MLRFYTILCPLDFSEPSRKAVGYAASLSRRYGARLYLQYVATPLEGLYVVPELAYRAEQLHREAQSQAEKELKSILESSQLQGISMEPVVSRGKPHEEILAVAAEKRVDLIVMGTHGLGTLDKFFLGSVTEKVTNRSTIPVLTVSPAEHGAGLRPEGTQLRRILCPVDFRAAALRPLEYSLSLSEEYEAELYLLHVVEEFSASELTVAASLAIPEFRLLRLQEARRRLASLIPTGVPPRCEIAPEVRTGNPAEEILKLGETLHVDLIVMGVHPISPLRAQFFGSTHYRVLRQAPCPVLTVPAA
ncbi:MAG: universal stress protein [Acidobacteria bacterium]|nr:universal stress protein [Acidobacteriota bacterium]